MQKMKALLSDYERELHERYFDRRKEAVLSMIQQYHIMATESEAKLNDQRTRLTEIDNHVNNPTVTAFLVEVEKELVQSHSARLAEALVSVLQQSNSMAHESFAELMDQLDRLKVIDNQANNQDQTPLVAAVDQEPVQNNSTQSMEVPLSSLQQDEITATESPAELMDLLPHGTEIETNNERSGLGSDTSWAGCVID